MVWIRTGPMIGRRDARSTATSRILVDRPTSAGVTARPLASALTSIRRPTPRNQMISPGSSPPTVTRWLSRPTSAPKALLQSGCSSGGGRKSSAVSAWPTDSFNQAPLSFRQSSIQLTCTFSMRPSSPRTIVGLPRSTSQAPRGVTMMICTLSVICSPARTERLKLMPPSPDFICGWSQALGARISALHSLSVLLRLTQALTRTSATVKRVGGSPLPAAARSRQRPHQVGRPKGAMPHASRSRSACGALITGPPTVMPDSLEPMLPQRGWAPKIEGSAGRGTSR